MAHRAEQIVAAVTTAVTGLATTGSNVFRGRAYNPGNAELPALFVWQGEDAVAEIHLTDDLVCTLEVNIDAMVAEVSAQVDTKLNLIRSEVTSALAADYQLGLAFVEDMQELGAAAPDIAGEPADRPVAAVRMAWRATYHRTRTDPDN